MSQIAEYVQAGVALLDEVKPGWETLIDTQSLHMCHNCILDQVFGNYEYAIKSLGIKGISDRYGFAGNSEIDEELKQEWLKVVDHRRSATT